MRRVRLFISLYKPSPPQSAELGVHNQYTVYERNLRRGDSRDPLSIDTSKTFFQQFGELYRAVPRPSVINDNNSV